MIFHLTPPLCCHSNTFPVWGLLSYTLTRLELESWSHVNMAKKLSFSVKNQRNQVSVIPYRLQLYYCFFSYTWHFRNKTVRGYNQYFYNNDICNDKGVACSDEPTESHHLNLQPCSALWNFIVSSAHFLSVWPICRISVKKALKTHCTLPSQHQTVDRCS